MTDPEQVARSLSKAQVRYLRAVAASETPYEPRHGRTANWALRHNYTDSIVTLNDGRSGPWNDFPLDERMAVRIASIDGQRLTTFGRAILERTDHHE